jgi:hypothetical protein
MSWSRNQTEWILGAVSGLGPGRAGLVAQLQCKLAVSQCFVRASADIYASF